MEIGNYDLVAGEKSDPTLNPRQKTTLNKILEIGGSRPFSEEGISEKLIDIIQSSTQNTIERWTEKNLYFTKSQFSSMGKCEGFLVEQKNQVLSKIPISVIVGNVAHRAIQLSYTHSHKNVSEYVKNAIIGMRSADKKIDDWFATSNISEQSDIITQATSKVINFLDDWPKLETSWSPRFEEPMSAKIGKITLSSRADLMLGRVRNDSKRTILLVDFKSGNLKEEHNDEAMFYALISTLRNGIMPFKSLIYSLSSGEYAEADLSLKKMIEFSEEVGRRVNAYVDLFTEKREPILLTSEQCNYCPLTKTCLEYKKNAVPNLIETAL